MRRPPGAGKSFSEKREITNAFFVTEDEYYPLVHALGGQVIHISPTSHDYINPMDINLDYSDDDNSLGFKYVGAITIYSHLQACGIINDHDSVR